MKLGPHTFSEVKTDRPKGDIYRNCAICNGDVVAEECIYQKYALYVRGFVTYGQERVTLEQWHRVEPKVEVK